MTERDQIQQVLGKISKTPLPAHASDSLFDAGVLDSFSLVDLVAGLEQKFGIKIPDSDLNPRQFDSVERIEQYLQSRR
ncbi:MAG TPA: acyl carrier protein [Pyrinomonadaceae bacterium]|nr:acyl carrier protein [Pyrinomonadaceae bacterium]